MRKRNRFARLGILSIALLLSLCVMGIGYAGWTDTVSVDVTMKMGYIEVALSEGEIDGYYIIPENYFSSGEFIYVSPDRTPFGSDGQEWMMKWTLAVNMIGGDTERASKIWELVDLQINRVDPTQSMIGSQMKIAPDLDIRVNPICSSSSCLLSSLFCSSSS